MKKKKTILFLIMLLILIGGLYFLFIHEKNKIILEDYTDVIINSNNQVEVFSNHQLSEYIQITNGKIISDEVIDSSVLGDQKIEVIYLNKDSKKYKAYLNIKVIDITPPIILGGNTYTIIKNNNPDLSIAFISVDNYDNVPKREIIGNYDYNNIGEYQLTLKVTDNSNNIATKKFTLKVVNNITTNPAIKTETLYSDVINNYKNDNTAIGIDVSRWQENIDYDQIKANGVEFVIMRVGFQEGFGGKSVLDSYFLKNITGAIEANIPIGVYYYSYATSIEEAKEQALWVLDQIKDYKISLPIAFDWESWSKFMTLNLSLHNFNEIAKVFIETINNNNYVGMNYSSKYYLENIWNLDDYPTWLAHYTKNTNYQKDYLFWQLCNDGIIPGINSPVDINIMNKNSKWFK